MPLKVLMDFGGGGFARYLEENFLTTAQLAEAMSVSQRTVFHWIERGSAPEHESFAGKKWFHKDAVASFEKPKPGPRRK